MNHIDAERWCWDRALALASRVRDLELRNDAVTLAFMKLWELHDQGDGLAMASAQRAIFDLLRKHRKYEQVHWLVAQVEGEGYNPENALIAKCTLDSLSWTAPPKYKRLFWWIENTDSDMEAYEALAKESDLSLRGWKSTHHRFRERWFGGIDPYAGMEAA